MRLWSLYLSISSKQGSTRLERGRFVIKDDASTHPVPCDQHTLYTQNTQIFHPGTSSGGPSRGEGGGDGGYPFNPQGSWSLPYFFCDQCACLSGPTRRQHLHAHIGHETQRVTFASLTYSIIIGLVDVFYSLAFAPVHLLFAHIHCIRQFIMVRCRVRWRKAGPTPAPRTRGASSRQSA